MKEAASQDGTSAISGDVQCSLLAHLLERSRLYHTRPDYLELLELVSRLRNFVPFDAMLLQAQKPGQTYAASVLGLADPFWSFTQGGRRAPRHAAAKAVLMRA